MSARKSYTARQNAEPVVGLPAGPLRRAVLVVEDHPAHRQMTQAVLEALGHHVTVVVDGFAAVEAASTTAFDVIVMDRHMPRCGGDQAALLIRSLHGPSRNAIIVCHSTDLPVGQDAPLYDDALEKPATSGSVLALLERLRSRAELST
jgi:CheY-like chemotaxis protein